MITARETSDLAVKTRSGWGEGIVPISVLYGHSDGVLPRDKDVSPGVYVQKMIGPCVFASVYELVSSEKKLLANVSV